MTTRAKRSAKPRKIEALLGEDCELLQGHCQLGVNSALLRLEVVRPRSFSTHTSPQPIRRTPAFGARGGASTGVDVARLESDSAQPRVPMRTVARGRPT